SPTVPLKPGRATTNCSGSSLGCGAAAAIVTARAYHRPSAARAPVLGPCYLPSVAEASERRRRLARPLLTARILVFLTGLAAGQGASSRELLESLGVAPGYALEVHATGLTLPTAVEFIPDPQNGPDDRSEEHT